MWSLGSRVLKLLAWTMLVVLGAYGMHPSKGVQAQGGEPILADGDEVSAYVPEASISPGSYFAAGELSAVSALSAEDVVEGWLIERGVRGASVSAVRAAGRGALVDVRFITSGLEHMGSGLRVRVDGAGQIRWISGHVPEFSGLPDFTPTMSARDALALVFGESATTMDVASHSRLAFLHGPGLRGTRLVWHLLFSDELRRETWSLYVDAHRGEVLSSENLVRHAPHHHARVWNLSPHEAELESVTFDALPPNADSLRDDDFAVLGCVDERRCHTLRTRAGIEHVHHCDMRPTAFTDEEGSFLEHRPPRSHRDAEDTFAEVQAYHHLRTGMEAFRRWAGDEDFALQRHLSTVVNMRVPNLQDEGSYCDREGETAAADAELLIEENAYFWPAGQFGPVELGDRIMLHQAHRTDWAYDGEVVYHELAHAVMHTTTDLSWRVPDELGVSYEGGGLHEGFADYFAAAISGSPAQCWYAGTDEEGPTPLGDISRVVHCGDVMTGEEHEESAAWSGALWAIRRGLRSSAKRAMFDRVAFTVSASLGPHDGFERATEILLAELELAAEVFADEYALSGRDEEVLWEQVRMAPERLWERGLPHCDGRVQTMAPGDEKEWLQLLGPNTFGIEEYREQPMPASMQVRLELAHDTEAIRLRVHASEDYDPAPKAPGMPTRPEVWLLIKSGDDPIRWEWELPRGTDDADDGVMVEFDDEGGAIAVLRGPFSAGVYHVQLANRGADWNLYGLSFEVAGADGVFAQGAADHGGRLNSRHGVSAGGCGVMRGAAPPVSWLLFMTLAVAWRRRR